MACPDAGYESSESELNDEGEFEPMMEMGSVVLAGFKSPFESDDDGHQDDGAKTPSTPRFTVNTFSPSKLLKGLRLAMESCLGAYEVHTDRSQQILAQIHEMSGQIVRNTAEYSDLIMEARKRDDVGPSQRWPGKKDAVYEIITTILLGLKKHKTLKHDWNIVLETAEAARVPRNRQACLDWIKENGGVDGIKKARAALANGGEADPKTKHEDALSIAIQYLRSLDPSGMPVDHTVPVTRLSNSLGVCFFQEVELGDEGKIGWVPISVTADDELLLAVYNGELKAEKKEQRSVLVEQDIAARNWYSQMRKHYKAHYKRYKKVTKLDFIEWADENWETFEGEKPVLARHYNVANDPRPKPIRRVKRQA